MASMIPKLPADVMDSIFKVFLANNDSCRTYCQNRLICKGINTLPYQFKSSTVLTLLMTFSITLRHGSPSVS
eukprot:gene28858-32046_t